MKIDSDADRFLRERLWGSLATTRNSGAPQVSMVAYDWNGEDLVISCRGSAAKFVNASRRPDVVFTVVDGLDFANVVGHATCHATGPVRDVATERVRMRLADDAPWAADMLAGDISAGLDEVGRVIIAVRPESVVLVRPLG